MSKKNYLDKNKLDIAYVEKEYFNLFLRIKKKGIEEEYNIVGILFHEIMAFYATNISAKNTEKYLKKKISSVFKENLSIKSFRKRSFPNHNKYHLIFTIYNKLLKFFFKKNLILGMNLPFNIHEKIQIFLFALFNGYLINYLPKLTKIEIKDYNFQIKAISQLNEKLSHKFKLKVESDKFIKFIQYYITSTQLSYRKKNIYLLGSLGKVYNRILAAEARQRKSKTIITNHEYTYGFLSLFVHRYDNYYLCDNYFTVGNLNPKKLDENYKSLSGRYPKIFYKKNDLKPFFSKKINTIDFSKLNELKGLYLPTRITQRQIQNNTFIYSDHYLSWQKKLIKTLPNVFIKPHLKFDLSKFPNNLKILNKKLKILDIYQKYDYLIVDQVSSRTFGEIAITNKPIIYFNIGLDSKHTTIGEKEIFKRVYETKVKIFNNYKGVEKVFKFKNKIINNRFLDIFCASSKKLNENSIFKLLEKIK